MKQHIHSLQELKHLKKQIDQHRAAEQARAHAAKQARTRQQAAQKQFAQAIGKVQPLPAQHHNRVQPQTAPVAPRPLQRERDQQQVLKEALSDAFDASSLLETDDSLSYRSQGIGSDVIRKLRQGHWSIQRQLDLHGLRRDAAREALGNFVRDSQRQGIRCVRVITGKGLGSPGKASIIKHKTYGWLVQKKEVLAFVQARPAEGGSGALVVLLASAQGV